ncbi:hypothetical protein [Bradyrhizobium roseum]|uniref:hypothetical protein n=1 Tax=Bradyrhizobium roseum TaxID=3056648 RepID=UPI002636BD7E|nr:hypothetical protein [Bradyrhizobium roseus]WKA25811.1 hypothetical protein QUH67_19480 [Bradyrhizobium roseus]
MGDGISGAGNAPAHQPIHRSGTNLADDMATKAKFDQALSQESCPPGLSRRPQEGCNYLRPPGQPEKKPDLTPHGDAGKGPMSGPRSDGPDLTTPIRKKPDSSPDIKLPDIRPTHDTTPSGTHVWGIKIPI